jgi:GR25 family glycosyltransferase involved in LPS biosynthesis
MNAASARIAITGRFQNSFFSGSIPQVAVSLARAFQHAGHVVTLLRPDGDPDWFIDARAHATAVPPRTTLASHNAATAPVFDVLIEVGWSLTPDDRRKYAKHVFYFMHYPPVFYDIESSVYAWNTNARNLTNVGAVMTYDMYSKQDVQYIELLAGKPVVQIPYVWDGAPLDVYCQESAVPAWADSARQAESAVPANVPKTMAWCARIIESNFSNSSSCVVPLNIVSVLRTKGCAIRFGVHNAAQTAQSPFFQTNVAKNLLLPDISGAMIPRVRLPDLRREKTALIAHQRFRPMKAFLLDALYLGIPMVHNCAGLRQYGAPYFYELNQIQGAAEQWLQMMSDADAQTGFFAPRAAEVRKAALNARFSPSAVAPALQALIGGWLTGGVLPRMQTHDALLPRVRRPPPAAAAAAAAGELRVAFANMWDDFQPKHNAFMYLLSWVGRMNNVRVVHDDVAPNVVFFGPLSRGAEQAYPGVPKVFFTGENAPKNTDADTFLNIGFAYDVHYEKYVRLPLWALELDWWGADPAKVVNPKYVRLEDALRVDPAVLDAKQKFCAFVATNPGNANRNAAFHILNQWRRVDSGGRLFCNLPTGPIPAGAGGGGGELAKVEFYKDYRFALTFENSSGPGYCTEKLFHAKVAGCVPIYWGDPNVDRDFDSRGYINVNQVGSAEQLVEAVKKIADDPVAWRRMAEVPALSEFKKRWCEKTMEHVARLIFKAITQKDIAPITEADWAGARTYATTVYETQAAAPVPATGRLFITAANIKYIESAVNAVASFRAQDKATPVHVYVWDDVPAELYGILQKVGATEIRRLPTRTASATPWPDFWEPAHFAWKLWIHAHAIETSPAGTSILYLDAGTVIAAPLDAIWKQIETAGIFLLDDATQRNERWCHPGFCAHMKPTPLELGGNQITAGLIGYTAGHPSNACFTEALDIARGHRDVIVGQKWHAYTGTCAGHRHDQSILSILTQRAGCPRLPLSEYYCDTSLRAAQQYGTPLYVHRGQFKQLVPFASNIDEAYVINLERRKDRLESFKCAHQYMKERTYVWKATDGRALRMTPDIAHCFRSNDFGWKKAVMGCALSHIGLWEKLANDTIAKSYLILEDDVRFASVWQDWWSAHAADMPQDADVVYLGGVLPPNKPAFPHIIEPANAHFGRVKPNTYYGGTTPRRYFHFCNYAYILTQSGAKKLVQLVKERGIFTSGDHMIVNHGDALLNIYFTTPLLANCFQEDDPVYQKSDFNNFSRVDNFDSDLWNNTDCFTRAEVDACVLEGMTAAPAAPAAPPAPTAPPAPAAIEEDVPQQHTPAPQPPTPKLTAELVQEHARATEEGTIQLWNDLFRAISLKQDAQHDTVRRCLVLVFDIWQSCSIDQLSKKLSYFRVLEQLVIIDEPMLRPHRAYMLERIAAFTTPKFAMVFEKMRAALDESKKPTSNGMAYYERPQEQRIPAFHIREINPSYFLEREWLDSVFPHPLDYKQFASVHDVVSAVVGASASAGAGPLYIFQKSTDVDVVKLLLLILDMLLPTKHQLCILHLSDEFGTDDISWYSHPSVKAVIRNYWRPDLAAAGSPDAASKVLVLPLGYTNGRSARGCAQIPAFEERGLVWSFAGSLDRDGRAAALEQLRAGAKPYREECKPTWTSPERVKADGYNTLLQTSKFVPCMRGSHALESYRLYEALEHGAIPVYVPTESPPHNAADVDEYSNLYAGKHPFLGFPSWAAAAECLPKLAAQPAVMEKHRAQLQAWWAAKKTELRVKLAALFT